MENKDLLEKAIVNVKQKNTRPSANPGVFAPSEEYRSLYDMMEVWDNEREAEDIQDKARYIYDSLKENGSPKDQLLSIISTLGVTPHGEKKVERVYRYIKLRKTADTHLRHYENVMREINAHSDNRR